MTDTLFSMCVSSILIVILLFALINNSLYHRGAEVNVMARTFSSSSHALISTTVAKSYYLKKQ